MSTQEELEEDHAAMNWLSKHAHWIKEDPTQLGSFYFVNPSNNRVKMGVGKLGMTFREAVRYGMSVLK